MPYRYGDERVREWMKEHKKETAAVQRRYDELKALSVKQLLKMAPDEVVSKVRDVLITGIIKSG